MPSSPNVRSGSCLVASILDHMVTSQGRSMSDPQQNQPAHQSQLHMKHGLDALPELVVPSGYSLRHFTPDDGPAWATLLDANGDLESWDAARAVPYFAADSRMPLEGAFFITSGHEPVATAQLHLKTDGPYAPIPE